MAIITKSVLDKYGEEKKNKPKVLTKAILNNYGKAKQIQEPDESALKTFGREAAYSAAPTVGGLAAGVAAGTAAAPLAAIPVVGVPLVIGVGLVGAIGGATLVEKAQKYAIGLFTSDEKEAELEQARAKGAQQNPVAAFAGSAAPQLLVMKPSPKNVITAAKFAKTLFTTLDKTAFKTLISSPLGQKELSNLLNVAVGGGVQGGQELIQQAKTGDYNAIKLIAQTVIGTVINEPNKFGVKLGMQPTGDFIVEEKAVATPEVEPVVKSPLAQEATKYKSAEEFVNSQKPVYHGTKSEFTNFEASYPKDALGNPKGVYFVDNLSEAKDYGKNIKEGYLDFKKPLVGNPYEIYAKEKGIKQIDVKLADVEKWLKDKGYDGIIKPAGSQYNLEGAEYIVLDKSAIKTKSQLTDIYNQAVKTAPEIVVTETKFLETPAVDVKSDKGRAIFTVDNNEGFIQRIVVGDKFQNKGEGTKLVQKIIEEAQNRGLTKLTVETASPASVGLFKKNNFKVSGTNNLGKPRFMTLDIKQDATKITPISKPTTPEAIKIKDIETLKERLTDENGKLDPVFEGSTLERQYELANNLVANVGEKTAIDIANKIIPLPKGYEELRPAALARLLAESENLTFEGYNRLMDNPNETPYSVSEAGSSLSLSRAKGEFNPVDVAKDVEKTRAKQAKKTGEKAVPNKSDLKNIIKKNLMC